MYRRALFIVVSTLVAAAFASAPRTSAQVEVSERPADIRSGSCASLGEVVVPLSSVVVPAGEAQGQAGATPVEQSVTTIPLFVEDLLATGHALAAYPSAQDVSTPIVCGDIGGALASDGTLAVGLNEMNSSRYSGVAYFVPTADGSGTTVTVMIMDQRAGRRGDDAAVGGGSPEGATPADTASTNSPTTGATTTDDASGVDGAVAPAPVTTPPPATAGVDGVETISADNADGENAKPRNKDKATAERDAHGNGGTVTSDGSTNGGNEGDRAKREGGAHAGEDGGANG